MQSRPKRFCDDPGRKIKRKARVHAGFRGVNLKKNLCIFNAEYGFTRKDCFRLKQAWQRWHLNDMRAGTPKQEEAVRKWRPTADDPSYDGACKMLESINLLVDGGYRYGTAWLKEEVPLDVLEWLFSLPGTGSTFSDVYSPEINQNDFDAILAAV